MWQKEARIYDTLGGPNNFPIFIILLQQSFIFTANSKYIMMLFSVINGKKSNLLKKSCENTL